MHHGWDAFLFLLTVQAVLCVLGSLQTQDKDDSAWGCPNLACYTDYFQTVTCLVETGLFRPDMLTLTWEDPYAELGDVATSCNLQEGPHNATHAQYTCCMNVSYFMADDIFSVNVTDRRGTRECGSFLLAQSIQPSPPLNVTVTFSGSYNVSWSCTYDSAPRPAPLKDWLQFELLYSTRGVPGGSRRKLVSVNTRSVSLLPLEFRPGSSYELRVRAGPLSDSYFAGTWSQWSTPVTFHTPPAGLQGMNLWPFLLLLALFTALVLGLKFHQSWSSLWWKVCGPVPSPEWFFQTLYMGHGGDFKKWVGSPFTASSLELGPWSQGPPSFLESYSSCLAPGAPKGADPSLLPAELELDMAPKLGSWGAAGATVGGPAYRTERDRPYGLVSIDTVTVMDAEGPWACSCADAGYPSLNLDMVPEKQLPGTTVLACGCVLDEAPAGSGDPSGSILGRLKVPLQDDADWVLGPPWGGRGSPGPSDSESGSPPAGLDMDTFDSGFAGSDCGSPMDEPSGEGPPRSYLRQWVFLDPAAGE